MSLKPIQLLIKYVQKNESATQNRHQKQAIFGGKMEFVH